MQMNRLISVMRRHHQASFLADYHEGSTDWNCEACLLLWVFSIDWSTHRLAASNAQIIWQKYSGYHFDRIRQRGRNSRCSSTGRCHHDKWASRRLASISKSQCRQDMILPITSFRRWLFISKMARKRNQAGQLLLSDYERLSGEVIKIMIEILS